MPPTSKLILNALAEGLTLQQWDEKDPAFADQVRASQGWPPRHVPVQRAATDAADSKPTQTVKRAPAPRKPTRAKVSTNPFDVDQAEAAPAPKRATKRTTGKSRKAE